jgi:hypothetical protein
MKRSVIRDRSLILSTVFPYYATLHTGYTAPLSQNQSTNIIEKVAERRNVNCQHTLIFKDIASPIEHLCTGRKNTEPIRARARAQ